MQVEQKLSIVNKNKFKPKWAVLFHTSEKVCRKLSLKRLMFVCFSLENTQDLQRI